MDREMILAAVGLGLAVVMLVVLAVVQEARKKKAAKQKLDEFREKHPSEIDAPAKSTPFFIACFRGHSARYFRVYSDRSALLFLFAGPYYAMIGPETPRGSDPRHWLLRSLRMVGVTFATGAVGAIVAVAVIARAIQRNAVSNPNSGGAIMLGILGIIGLLALLVIVLVPGVVWWITRRVSLLDNMTLKGLREHAEAHERSFRATTQTVSNAKFELLATSNSVYPNEIGATIRFRHRPTGKWTVETLTTQDTKDALAAFRAMLGEGGVTLEQNLQDRLSPPAIVASSPTESVAAIENPQEVRPFGFPLLMTLGVMMGGVVAVALSFMLAPTGQRISYTMLVQLVFALGLAGAYLGHLLGASLSKNTGHNPLGPLSMQVMLTGATIWFLGCMAMVGAVLGVMSAMFGMPPH